MGGIIVGEHRTRGSPCAAQLIGEFEGAEMNVSDEIVIALQPMRVVGSSGQRGSIEAANDDHVGNRPDARSRSETEDT